MVSTSSFLRLELKADDMAEFLAKKEELLADGFQEADKPVCATGIITQYFWKAPESFDVVEADEEGEEEPTPEPEPEPEPEPTPEPEPEPEP